MNWVLIALLTATPQSTPAPKPWLGVNMGPHNAKIEAEGTSYKHGIRISRVVFDSPAYKAGLRAGDIVVRVGDDKLDCKSEELLNRMRQQIVSRKVGDPLEMIVYRDGVETDSRLNGEPYPDPEAWENPEKFLQGRQPGDKMSYTAERVRKLLTITPTLGAAPESNAGLRPLPPNEAIFDPTIQPLAEERLAEALIDEFKTRDDYEDLRKRLARLVENGDAMRLSRVAYAMREPFTMPVLGRRLADVPDDLPGLLSHAAAWTDAPTDAARPELKTGLSADEHARQIEQLLTSANEHFENAFAALSADERKTLTDDLDALSEAFIKHVMVLDDPVADRLNKVINLAGLAEKVDRSQLVAAAITLSALLDDNYLNGLKKDLGAGKSGVILKHDTPFGPIIFAGGGKSWHQQPAAVLIDLGGDDFYTHTTQRPFSVVIDLGGNDLYQATFTGAQGCGTLGVSILYDNAGDDTYIAQRWSQGSAAFGVGVLYDNAGNDIYRGEDFSQGAAYCGVGLLIDGGGRDRYSAPRYSQAVGMPGGFGGLIERGGDDHYYCSGRDKTGYDTQGVFDAFGQGCGIGFRNLSSGGIALLLDESGDDIYEAGNFSQGGGYYFGWGSLVDRDGSDRYLGARYAQAFAAHQAIGFLEDYAGDDYYLARREVGQSSSWDETVTALLDHAGDDFYSGGGFGLGASAHNGFALLVDYAGRDEYEKHLGFPRASPNTYHGGTSFSLLLDFGGDEDKYAGKGRNGAVTHGQAHGFFADLPGDENSARTQFRRFLRQIGVGKTG